ncbi:MAG TPA: CpsB/CapC family capsule biosynthesis tyrosine phosphatase [Chitinophagaceae bacterium]|nr:CpsB/CapC family capsule biosynthesis tyrosine phosphatase [Chitinophagaceae bacterium]
MFNLFSKKKTKGEKFDFALLKTDIHSHLLPGIDDGPKDIATSLQLIRGMKDLGYQKLITTPHIIWDMYRNTPAIINAKLELVREAIKKEGIEIEIHAAAEYFLDEHVEELLKTKEPLLTISGNKVLTEFSLAFPSLNTRDILFDMQMHGYQPVIAHPERYIYLQQHKEFYRELKDIGCLFQLNILSLYGHYGRSVKDLAEYLLNNGFYDLAGTDLHHSRHLEELQHVEMTAPLRKAIESGQISNSKL